MTYRLRNIGIAVALALVAALLVLMYVGSVKRDLQADEEPVTVWVAKGDIQAGTPGSEVIESALLETQQVAHKSVAPGAIVKPQDIEDLVAVEPIYTGEQVTTLRFKSEEAKGPRAQLTGNLRALEVAGTAPQLLAGTLKAGDRVDVVATIKYKFVHFVEPRDDSSDEEMVATRVVLRDLLVLRGPASGGASAKVTRPDGDLSVLLALTDSQAQKLVFVTQSDGSNWTLQLRPTDDPADSPESVETVGSVLGDGLKPEQLDQLVTGRSAR